MVADEKKQVEEVGVDEQGEAVVELSPEEMKERMAQLFTTGKKDYVEEKFELAVNSLEEAVQLADKVFGLKAPETFEYYLYYGKALLEVGREENVIFQNAQKGMPTQDDSMVSADTSVLTEGTLETIKEQVEEAIEENTKALERNAEKAEEGENSDEKKEDAEVGDDAEEEEDDVADEGEEEQEPIQAAWEIFEHCRLICENQEESKDWDLKRADVFMYLGDCSAENSNFDQAIEDLGKSQELKEKHGCIGRKLADVLIELARVYKLADNFHSAAQFYEKSKATLEQQIGVLEKGEGNEATTKEITDIRGILDDLQGQIDDVIESTRQVDVYKTMTGDQSASTNSKIPSAPLDGKAGTTIEARKAPKRPASGDPSEDTENVEAKKMKEAVEKEKTDTTDTTETPRENIDGSITTA